MINLVSPYDDEYIETTYVEIYLVEIAVGLKHDVHVVQASYLVGQLPLAVKSRIVAWITDVFVAPEVV